MRYWAAMKAAADRASDEVSGATLADVLEAVRGRHAGNERFARVLSISSILVGERPIGHLDPAHVLVDPGDVIDVLPPFAGG